MNQWIELLVATTKSVIQFWISSLIGYVNEFYFLSACSHVFFFWSLLRVICAIMLLCFIFLGVVVAGCQFIWPFHGMHASVRLFLSSSFLYFLLLLLRGVSSLGPLMPYVRFGSLFLFHLSVGLTSPYRFWFCHWLHEKKSLYLGQCHIFSFCWIHWNDITHIFLLARDVVRSNFGCWKPTNAGLTLHALGYFLSSCFTGCCFNAA